MSFPHAWIRGLFSSCTMLKHCHKSAAGAVKNTISLKASSQSNFIGQQGKILNRKEPKKATSIAGFLIPFIKSEVFQWGCRFCLPVGCNILPMVSTWNTSDVTVKSSIQYMSDSITVREDEISCSPDPTWKDDLTVCTSINCKIFKWGIFHLTTYLLKKKQNETNKGDH